MFVNGNALRRIARLAALSSVGALLLACGPGSPDKLIASAKDYIAKGDHPAAVIQLKNALQAAPENGEARYLLGKASVETRDFASAEKELRRALELNQPADSVLPLLARAMTENGQLDALIKEFGERKLADPQAQAAFQTRLADAYLRRGDRAAADKAYAAALGAVGDYAPARLGRVMLKALDGKVDAALSDVDGLLASAPKLAEAHSFKGDLLLAKGDRAGAKKAFEAAIENDAKLLSPRLSLIGVLSDEREFDAATKLVESTRKVAPGDLRVVYLDAALAFRKGESDKARQGVQQVLKYLPEHIPSLVLAGSIDMQGQQFAAAEGNLRKAVARAPGHLGARMLLVQTYLRMGQPARAKETLQPLIERGMPPDPRLQLLAGETLLANGDVAGATSFYQAAAKGTDAQEVAARTRLGQIALATGKSDEGFKELEAASELDAGAYQADLALIAGHLRRNEIDKALAAVKSLEKKQPKNPLTFQMYGVVNLAKRDLAAARGSFEKALELQPNYLPAAFNLAQLDILAKKPEDARKRFEAMIAKEPNNEQLHLALADVQGRTGVEAKEVGATLQRAVKANPQAPAARLALINFRLRSGDPKAALTAAQDAMAAMPSDPRVLDAAGMAQEAAGEVNQAIETYNKLAVLQPQAVQPLYRLAALYVRQKDTNKAIDSLRRVQKIAPRERDVVPQLVQVYLAAERHDDALREARQLQKSEPKFAGGFALEGDVYLTQRKFAEAERFYRDALKLDLKANATAIKLHTALAAAGKVSDATAWSRKWIAENPKDGAMRLYLGEAELRNKNLKAAAGHYQAVVGLDPNNALALNNLAWIGGELGDPKALEYAERAVRLAPGNAAIIDTYGMLLVKKGEAAKALPFLERARTLAPARNDLRLNYAKALVKAGKKDEARKELEALQAVTENFAGKDEIAGLLKSL